MKSRRVDRQQRHDSLRRDDRRRGARRRRRGGHAAMCRPYTVVAGVPAEVEGHVKDAVVETASEGQRSGR